MDELLHLCVPVEPIYCQNPFATGERSREGEGGQDGERGEGRRHTGEGGGGRDRKREAGKEEEGGKTHRGKHPLLVFSALNSAVSVW